MNQLNSWKPTAILYLILSLGWIATACSTSQSPFDVTESATPLPSSTAIPETTSESSSQGKTSTPIVAIVEVQIASPDTALLDTPTFESTATGTPTVTTTPTSVPWMGEIAFASSRYDTNEDSAISKDDGINIYRLDLHSQQVVQLTFGSQRDAMPSWSPNGEQIVFVSNRTGNADLYKMQADGSNVQQLTYTPENETSPAWSPDGSTIAYVSVKTLDSGLQERKLYLISEDGSSLQELPVNSGDIYSPDWSPDGRFLVFERVDRIQEDGQTRNVSKIYFWDFQINASILLETQQELTQQNFIFRNPKWLPREDYLLSLEQVPGNIYSTEIKVFELDLGEGVPRLHQQFSVADAIGPYSWGPNGEWLVIVISNDKHDQAVTDTALFDLTLLRIDYSMHLPISGFHFYYEPINGDLITDNTFYDSEPDWRP